MMCALQQLEELSVAGCTALCSLPIGAPFGAGSDGSDVPGSNLVGCTLRSLNVQRTQVGCPRAYKLGSALPLPAVLIRA